MLNAGLGVVFTAVGAVFLIVKKAAVLSLVANIGYDSGMITVVVILGICLLATTVLFTAPSVSLEGKTIWIVKSMPVSEKDILKAKLNLHIRLAAPPMILASFAAAFVFTPSLANLVLMIVAPVFYVMLSANIGLICNLKVPNLDWVNETQVVKQSISVLLSMLFNFLLVLIPGVLYFVLPSVSGASLIFMLAYTLLLILGWRLTQKWIFTKGAKVFQGLG